VVRLTVEWSNGGNYTAMQAAHILRLTPTRVRQLLQSGELEGERDEAGHWLIPARAVHERLERLRRESFLEAVGYDPSSVRELQEIVEVLSSQVETLRAELDEAHAANRENRRIIAGLVESIPPVIEPPRQEARGGPESAAEASEGEPRSAGGGPQKARERPSGASEEELAVERRGREEAERERGDLRRELETTREARLSTEALIQDPEGEEVWLDAEGPHSGTEARERPETTEAQPDGEAARMKEEPFPHEEERPEEAAQRPWWRRMFGG
jgi:hypothetical protein